MTVEEMLVELLAMALYKNDHRDAGLVPNWTDATPDERQMYRDTVLAADTADKLYDVDS